MKKLICIFAIASMASCQPSEPAQPAHEVNIIVGKEDSCLVETAPTVFSMQRVPVGMKAFFYATPAEMAQGRLHENWTVDSAKAHYVGDTIYVKK